MYTKADTDPAVVEELHKILRAAALASKDLPRLYARDYCTTANYTLKQSNDSFAKWSKLWPEKLAKLKK
jgi:hypothetical protein